MVEAVGPAPVPTPASRGGVLVRDRGTRRGRFVSMGVVRPGSASPGPGSFASATVVIRLISGDQDTSTILDTVFSGFRMVPRTSRAVLKGFGAMVCEFLAGNGWHFFGAATKNRTGLKVFPSADAFLPDCHSERLATTGEVLLSRAKLGAAIPGASGPKPLSTAFTKNDTSVLRVFAVHKAPK